jgi:hypothetical protein
MRPRASRVDWERGGVTRCSEPAWGFLCPRKLAMLEDSHPHEVTASCRIWS